MITCYLSLSYLMPAVHSHRENPRQDKSENVNETLALPWMLSYSLGRLCLTLLALAFLAVRDVRVKGSCVSPNCHIWFLIVFFQSAFPGGLRAHGHSVQSHTRTASSRVTLARESCQTHSAGVYSSISESDKH